MNRIEFQLQRNYPAEISRNDPVGPGAREQKRRGADAADGSFSVALERAVRQSGLTFSKHALQRIDARGIEMTPERMEKLGDAVERAKGKGVRDALILDGENAFIVDIPNATVVTTIGGGERKDNIFTNIDGAVIL